MSRNGKSRIPEILKNNESDLLAAWIKEQLNQGGQSPARIGEVELREQCRSFLRLVQEAAQSTNITNVTATEWEGVLELLADISRSRARQGYTPSETATFVFSLKQPLFASLRREVGKDADTLAE